MAPRPAVLAAALLLGLSACSLSDGEQASADSLARAVVTESTPDDVRANAECIAQKWVGEVGVEQLAEDGLLNRKGEAATARVRRALSGRAPVAPGTAKAYAASWLACTDFDEVALEQREAMPKASAEQLDELADCLKERDRTRWTKAGMRVAQARTRAIARCARTVIGRS